MKFKYTYKDEDDGNKEKTLWFLRTLNTEKMYRDQLAEDEPVEFLKDLTAVIGVYMKMSDLDTNDEVLQDFLSLDFIDTRHDLLKFMYAENKNGKLVQNEETRKHFDELEINENEVMATFMKR